MPFSKPNRPRMTRGCSTAILESGWKFRRWRRQSARWRSSRRLSADLCAEESLRQTDPERIRPSSCITVSGACCSPTHPSAKLTTVSTLLATRVLPLNSVAMLCRYAFIDEARRLSVYPARHEPLLVIAHLPHYMSTAGVFLSVVGYTVLSASRWRPHAKAE